MVSTSNRGCSRIQAPVSSTIAMLSRPRMCDGGVMICMRSAAVRPSASRQCSMAAANPAWLWRTALGMPVVPELNTNSASASGATAGPGRSPGVIGSSRCTIGRCSASSGWSPTAWFARVSSSAWAISVVFHAGLMRTAAAPRRQIARRAMTNSGRFDDIIATRSPGPTPRCANVAAMPPASASSSVRVYSRSPNASTADSPMSLTCRFHQR